MSRDPSSNPPRKSVQAIRARFESQDSKPTPTSPQPQVLQTLQQRRSQADMSASRKNHLSTDQPIGINASPAEVISSPSSSTQPSTSTQPSASTRPFWIGPDPTSPRSTSGSAMEYPVAIEFVSPGLRPPVFICTNLSEPAWEPVEMNFDNMEHGEYLFHSVFSAKQGKYQYKLRLGPGDWWVCDESKPTVDDGAGNRNNVVTVEPNDTQSEADYVDEDRNSRTYGRRISAVHGVPLFEHESFSKRKPHPLDNPIDDVEDEFKEPDELAPLFPHEKLTPSQYKLGEGSSSSRWPRSGSSSRSSVSARRDSGQRTTIDESDLDDPRLQPCLENKDAILDLAQRMSSGLPPCLEAPHPSVVTKLINRAYDVMQIPDYRPSQRRPSTTEEIMSALGLGGGPDDKASPKLAIITEGDEDMNSTEQTSGKHAALFGHASDPFAAPLATGNEGPMVANSEGNDGATEIEEQRQHIESRDNNPSAVFLGLGFAFAVAATAVSIWGMRSRS